MRTAKLIITTLLALQLFVTAGLCGGVCCANVADHNVSTPEDNYKPAAEEKVEGGHCPMHAAKEAAPKPQERKRHSSNATQRPGASHQQNHQAESSSAINAHLCACSVEREAQSFDALLQRSLEKRPAAQILSSAPNLPYWLIESSSPQTISPDSFQSHSPPFSGRHLNLRI
jgi:hypothetical protein